MAGAMQAARPHLLRMKGESLLLGWLGIGDLTVTNTRGTIAVPPYVTGLEPFELRTGSPRFSSLSRDGKLIATMKLKAPSRMAVVVFSLADDQWTEYAEAPNVVAVAIAPGGNRLAFTSGGGLGNLYVIDLKTGACRQVSRSVTIGLTPLSWGPDGRLIAYEGENGKIAIIDVETGQVRELVSGEYPSWAPSGEWIAYYSAQNRRCMIVRPDGTEAKALWEAHKDRVFEFLPPVWSPDSKKVLLNEGTEYTPATIWMFDLEKNRMEKLGPSAYVLGWAKDN